LKIAGFIYLNKSFWLVQSAALEASRTESNWSYSGLYAAKFIKLLCTELYSIHENKQSS